jgi:hypothetical protein
MTDVAELSLRIDSLEARVAKADLDKLAAAGKTTAASADLLASAFSRLMVILGPAALAAAFVSSVKGALALQESYVRLSEVAGTTAAMMSAFDLPARLAGTSLDTVAMSVARLSKSLGEAQLGDVSKMGMFKALGIDPKDGRDAAAVMVDVAKALTGMKDQNVAAAASIVLLNRGFAELRPFMKEVAEQGTLVARGTDEQFKAAKAFEDELTKLNFQLGQSKIALANDLLPALNATVVAMNAAYRESGLFAAAIIGIQVALTGTDLMKANREIFETGETIARLGKRINELGAGGKDRSPWFDSTLLRDLNTQMDAAQERLARAVEYKRQLEQPGTVSGQTPGTKDGMDESAVGGIIAEERVRRLMKAQKNYEALIAEAKGFAERYAEAIKLGNALAAEANKQGRLSDQELIEQVSANEEARLTVLQQSLEKQEALHEQQGALGKRAETAEAIAQVNAQIVANQALTTARLGTLLAVQVTDYEKWRRSLFGAGEQIAMSFGTEKEIEDRAYEERRFALEVFLIDQGELYEHADRDRERLALEHEAKLGSIAAQGELDRLKIKQQSLTKQAQYHVSMFTEILQGAGQYNKKFFELEKAASLATAIIKGIEAVQKAYAWGASWGGPAGGAAMAAIAAAATAVNVQAIANTQFSGGAGGVAAAPVFAASPSTGLPAEAAPAAPATQTIVHFVSGGELISKEQLRQLFDLINESTRDGGRILLQ